MHFGTLPSSYQPGRSYLDAAALAHSAARAGLSRRAMLGLAPVVLGFAGGTAAGWGGVAWFRGDTAPAGAAGDPATVTLPAGPVEPGSLEWALWIQHGPETGFLAAAGELERVRMSTAGDPRLVPVFERLLDVALRSDEASADPAGAIAVRCLSRLGALHRVEILNERLDDRDQRPETLREVRKVLRRSRGGRRR